MPNRTDDDFSFEILEAIGVINTTQRGWYKELNFVRWNSNAAKYDIRDWHPDHGKMGRGITLTEEELIHLGEIIRRRFPDGAVKDNDAAEAGEVAVQQNEPA